MRAARPRTPRAPSPPPGRRCPDGRAPEFSPQLGTTVDDLVHRVMRLDVTDAVARLKEIFPLAPSERGSGADFGEPASYLADSQRTYEHEHAAIFDPMLRLYGLIRRIGAAVTYHMGAIG